MVPWDRPAVVEGEWTEFQVEAGSWLDDRGNINTPNHRVGPMIAYVFRSRNPRFSQPMLALIVNWWINNRYRSGQAVSNALPYGAVAFQFNGTLWSL